VTKNNTPSAFEKGTGSLATEIALTTVAAASGGLLAPLLPVLMKSMSAQRQQRRIEEAIGEIHKDLEQQEEKIRNLTDAQYKLISESLIALRQTTQEKKIDYLRFAVSNALNMQDLQDQDAIMLSRVIRDISADEVAFLLRTFSFDGVIFGEETKLPEALGKVLFIQPESPEAMSAIGLQSLGVLAPPATGWDGGTMRFTRIAAKLIALLRNPSTSGT
jgi:hypothetical protein